MYDPLYKQLEKFTQLTGIQVTIDFAGDHPTLNHHIASFDEIPYHLISTHSKYLSSQQAYLAPLEGVLEAEELHDFAPTILDLMRIDGKLYALPRNIDVRLLHYRTDYIDTPPDTWADLIQLAHRLTTAPNFYGFIFPGRDSGLFGTFFELVEAAGASLFPHDLIPQIVNEQGLWAIDLITEFYRDAVVPSQIIDWHYDSVHQQFLAGNIAMVGDWPGYYSSYRDEAISKVANRFRVAPYPTGPSGHARTYGGSHTFALSSLGAQNSDAVDLLRFLTAFDQQFGEAQRGSVPVRHSVMQAIQATATNDEKARWSTLEKVIQEQIIIPPKLGVYPLIEEILWTTVQQAMVGKIGSREALVLITHNIQNMIQEKHDGRPV
jgi:multiple sugar transport system substrate-binding protein